MRGLASCRRFLATARHIIGKHKYEQIVCAETEIYSPLLNNELYYRGHSVRDLASKKKFLETFYLLLNADLPSSNQNADFVERIVCGARAVPSFVREHSALLPSNINVCDFMTSSWSLMNSLGDPKFDRDYPFIFGQSLGILGLRFWGAESGDYSPDPVSRFSRELLFNQGAHVSNEHDNMLNSILTLYMDHGLTSASYNSRVCISEGGSTLSGLICAAATQKYALETLDSYLPFSQLGEDQLDDLVLSFEKDNNLRFPLDEVTFKRRDPRCLILTEICKERFWEDPFPRLTGMQGRLGSRLHFKFDVYVFDLVTRLCEELNRAASPVPESLSDSEGPMGHLKERVAAVLLMSRIAGWLSHISEQRKMGRRIEHVAAYVGEPPKRTLP